jgi:hypothetical protein
LHLLSVFSEFLSLLAREQGHEDMSASSADMSEFFVSLEVIETNRAGEVDITKVSCKQLFKLSSVKEIQLYD